MKGRKSGMEVILVNTQIDSFITYLAGMERSGATIRKYERDVRRFLEFAREGTLVTRKVVVEYKGYLERHYQLSSANSMLAALNLLSGAYPLRGL